MSESAVEMSFCTTREAATLLGVSVGTVQLWVESGLLQAWKTAGGHRRVLRDSVERLIHKKSQPTGAQFVPVAPGSQRLRVMVVEDDVSLLRLYEVNMLRWPMAPEVFAFDNAIAALLMMGRQRPDLLVVDLNMPGMDGFKMLNTLRSSPEMKQATIVVVSGLARAEIDARGGIPADIEILPKPIPFAQLLTIATRVNQARTTGPQP
jgi:excisionase family DNA binding protein